MGRRKKLERAAELDVETINKAFAICLELLEQERAMRSYTTINVPTTHTTDGTETVKFLGLTTSTVIG